MRRATLGPERMRLAPAVALVAVAAAAAGCGAHGYGHDVNGFVRQADTPVQQAVLRSIATYRTTTDENLACSLVTPHFLQIRFDGKLEVCQALARSAEKRELPESAAVEGPAGDSARVKIKEATPVRSVYSMRRVGDTWKIDDITEDP